VRAVVPLDRWVLERSGGRFTALGPFGTPLLLLTTTGARSGAPRTTPLLYLHDGDRILLAASNFGQGRHPAWSANLLACPRAVVAIGGERIAVVARLLEGEERDLAWRRFEEAARPYRAYGDRTDRTIRLFSLERADTEEG
jgi:deazaflavin-dependent oxidoreductase (nitroreductase family)